MVSRRWSSSGTTLRNLSGNLAKDGSSRGIVMLGGWTATVDYWGGEMAGMEDGVNITRTVVEEPSRLTCSCATDSTWGNSTIVTRIDTLVTACQSSGYFPSGKVHLFGNSMGTLCALKYALANPTKVASLALALPAPDLQWLYDNNPLGVTSSISTAYGGEPTDNDNPATRTAEFTGFPIKMWIASNDTTADTDAAYTFADAVGAETVDMGAVGHTWGDKSIFNGSEVAAFVAQHD